jgi:hypothetical protein
MAKYLTIYDHPIVELLPKSKLGRFKIYVPIKHKLIDGKEIMVPFDFVSNGASVPRLLRGLFSQQGVYLTSAIIHDYLYDNNYHSREFADRQFLIDMGRTNTNKFTKWLFYIVIRIFGGINWKKYGRTN